MLGTLRQQVLEKGNGGLGISLLIRFEHKLLGVKVECAKVSLLLSLVDHWDFDALVSFAPHIPANIPPQQMTLIQEEHH